MSVDKISSGPACDPKSLFIEITGINHPVEHSIQFYDESDNKQQIALENKKETQTLIDTTIHNWNWVGQTKPVNAWLAITSDNGHIKVPLYQDLKSCLRKEFRQDYLMHAVMPLTLLPTFEKNTKEQDRLAPVRDGYFYVFYNNLAWREIEIRHQGDGKVEFKYVDLYQYRAGKDKPFSDDRRLATGSPLSEIWLPAQDNNSQTTVHLAFSEVQWSGARLNYLEKNTKKLHQRVKPLGQYNQQSSDDSMFAAKLPQMRAREMHIELKLANIQAFNRDLSGEYLTTLYKQVQTDLQALQEGGKSAMRAYTHNYEAQPEYGALEQALREILTKNNKESPEVEAFDKAEPFSDYLTDSKARKLLTINVFDQLFELQYRTAQPQLAAGYLQLIHQDISQQKYVQSAQLVQQMIMPAKFGKNKNALHKHKDVFDTYGGGVYHRTLRTLERAQFRRHMSYLQQSLMQVVNDRVTAIQLLDLTSLNEVNGAAGHALISNALEALSLHGDKLAGLVPIEQQKPLESLNTIVNIFNPAGNHPLHPVMFMPPGSVCLAGEYTAPEASNDGSGLASAQNIARWSDKYLLNASKVKHIEHPIITVVISNNESTFGSYRRVANTVDNILKGFFTAILIVKEATIKGTIAIEFRNMYVSILELNKITQSSSLSKLTFAPTTGIPETGYSVGVNGAGLKYGLTEAEQEYKYGKRQSKIAYGSVRQENGNLFASTRKNDFAPSIKTKLVSKMTLVIDISQNSQLAQEQEQVQRALKNVEEQGATSSNLYQKFRVPYIISIIEIVNLITTFEALKTETDFKKMGVNIISALADLGLALAYSAKMMSERAYTLITNFDKKIITFSAAQIKKYSFSVGKAQIQLVGSVKLLSLLGTGAGLITAGIAIWDTCRLIGEQDYDAALGMAMVATGTGLTTIFSGLFSASSTFLTLGPIAWFGLALAATGGVLVYLLTDDDIEKWLKRGPFGKSPNTDEYAQLQKPQIAFNQLLDLLMSTSITTYPLHKMKLPLQDTEDFERHGITHGIYVRSNLMQLLDTKEFTVRFHARQSIKRLATITSPAGDSEQIDYIKKSSLDSQIKAERATEDGRIYFLTHQDRMPNDGYKTNIIKSSVAHFKHSRYFRGRAQFIVGNKSFPTLPLDQLKNQGSSQLPPTFTDQDYGWADEINFVIS